MCEVTDIFHSSLLRSLLWVTLDNTWEWTFRPLKKGSIFDKEKLTRNSVTF